MTIQKRAARLIAASLGLALIHASFGPAAWAQVASIGGNVAAPVGGASAAAGAAGAANAAGAGNASALQPMTGTLLAPGADSSALLSAPESSPVPSAFAAGSLKRRYGLPSLGVDSNRTAAPPKANRDDAGVPAATSKQPAAAEKDPGASVAGTTGKVGELVSRRFAELEKSFVAAKDPGAVEGAADAPSSRGLKLSARPDAQAATTTGGSDEKAPPSPAADSSGEKGGGWSFKAAGAFLKKHAKIGLGAAVSFLIGGMLIEQVGAEAQGAAMSQLTENVFHDFSKLAQIQIFSMVGSMVGRELSQFVIAKLGLRRTYFASQFMRAATIGAMIFLLGIGHMPLALMGVFYAVNGVVSGVMATAEGTIRQLVVGTGEGRQEKFRSFFQLLAETIGFVAPILFGALVPVLGASVITAIYPATIVIAVLLLIAKKVVPRDALQKLAELEPGNKPGPRLSFVARLLIPLARRLVPAEALKKLAESAAAASAVRQSRTLGERFLFWIAKPFSWTGAEPEAPGPKLSFDAKLLLRLCKIFVPAEALKELAEAAATDKNPSYESESIGEKFLLWIGKPFAATGKAGKGGAESPDQGARPHGLKAVWTAVKEGWSIVWHDPALRFSFLLAGLFDLLNGLLYSLLSPGFGKLIGGAKGMSPIAGMVDGLYSLGGLLASVVLLSAARRSAAKRKAMTAAESAESDRRAMLRWAMWVIPALLAVASMALPLPALGVLVHLPKILAWAGALTLPALALIPFGIIQVAASIKANSYFSDKLPADTDKVQKALAFQGSASTLIEIAAMLLLKPLFTTISAAHNPFHWIALGLIPFGALLFYLQRRLASASHDAASTEPKKPKAPFGSGLLHWLGHWFERA